MRQWVKKLIRFCCASFKIEPTQLKSLVSTLWLCLLLIVGWAKLGLSSQLYRYIYLVFLLTGCARLQKILFLPLENKLLCLRASLSYLLCMCKWLCIFFPAKFKATRSSCADFSCLMNNRWEREISGYEVFVERAPRSNPPSSILVLKLWLSVFTSNCRLNEIRALKVNYTFFPAFNCQFL